MIIGETPLPAGALGVDAIAMTMRFGDFLALDNVELKVRPGSFHALLGENGAGKSTLASILTGLYRPDSGEIAIDGKTVEFHSPRDATEAGVSMVHQHFRLAASLTVADNIVLGHRGTPWLRGGVCGLMTAVGGLGHTLPYLIPNFWTATVVAFAVVAIELAAISYIRHRFMDTPFLAATFQVVVGGVLVFAAGILIGSS